MESSQIFHLYYSSISSIIMIFRPILSGFRFLGSFLDPDIPIVEDPLYCLFKFLDEKSFHSRCFLYAISKWHSGFIAFGFKMNEFFYLELHGDLHMLGPNLPDDKHIFLNELE